MRGIEVVRRGSLREGGTTPGIFHVKAFDSGPVLVSKSKVETGVVSSWHHHGTRLLFAYVVSGRLRLECRGDGNGPCEAGGETFSTSQLASSAETSI